MKQKTAILLFSRSPQEEAEAKENFSLASKKQALLLSESLLKNSIRAARQSHLPVLQIMGGKQVGKDFGQKITNALEYSFGQGYENIIVIGIDSPGLNYRHILKAQRLLEKDQNTILGPSKDGGVYLIGINKNQFNPHVLRNLAWHSSLLQEDWSKKEAAIEWLQELQDIDQREDLWTLLSVPIHFDFERIHEILLTLFQLIRKNFLSLKAWLKNQSLPPSFSLRGPPSFIISY